MGVGVLPNTEHIKLGASYLLQTEHVDMISFFVCVYLRRKRERARRSCSLLFFLSEEEEDQKKERDRKSAHRKKWEIEKKDGNG